MKTYKVTFTDTIKANTEDDAYGELLFALRNLLKDHKRMFPEAHPNSTIKWSECEEVKQAKRAIAKAQGN